MGLKISQFKKNGGVFVGAYAKVSGINYNNDTKIASFGLSIYSSKEDRNLICEIKSMWVKVIPNEDLVAQCYSKIQTNIEQTKNQILRKQIEIDSVVDNDNLKLRLESMLSNIKQDDILQFDGAVSE